MDIKKLYYNTVKPLVGPEINGADFISRANDTALTYEKGIIDSLFIAGEGVFAVVRKDHLEPKYTEAGSMIDHGDGFFNGDESRIGDYTLDELSILTNIDAANNQIYRYKGKPCIVTVSNGNAIFADVLHAPMSLTAIPTSLVRKVRHSLGPDIDSLFSKEGKAALKAEGLTEEEIKHLNDFRYVEEMTGKVNTFEGEGLWFKDTTEKDPDENILKANPLVIGLNKMKMKTRECHHPSRVFSGK